jgi:hypothetical protein
MQVSREGIRLMFAPVRTVWRLGAPNAPQVGLALCRRGLRGHLAAMAMEFVAPDWSAQAVPLANRVISLVQPIRTTPYWREQSRQPAHRRGAAEPHDLAAGQVS